MALETKLKEKGITHELKEEVKVEIKKTTKKKPIEKPKVEEILFDPRQQIKYKRK